MSVFTRTFSGTSGNTILVSLWLFWKVYIVHTKRIYSTNTFYFHISRCNLRWGCLISSWWRRSWSFRGVRGLNSWRSWHSLSGASFSPSTWWRHMKRSSHKTKMAPWSSQSRSPHTSRRSSQSSTRATSMRTTASLTTTSMFFRTFPCQIGSLWRSKPTS